MGYPRPHKLPVPETTDLTLVIVFGIDIIHFVFHLHLLFCRYQHFRRSQAGIHNILTCVPESSNIYDRWAVTAVQDDMGNVIGRVPKNICNIISISQSVHHTLVRAICIYTGEMLHDPPVEGGGPKLKCVYLVEFLPNVNLQSIAEQLNRHLEDDDFFL
jgi:hypothetical protein